MDQNWVQDDTFVPLKTVKKMDEYLSDFAKKFHLTTNETESRNYPLEVKSDFTSIRLCCRINSEELKQKEYKGYKDDAVIKRDSKNFTIKSSKHEDGYRVTIVYATEQYNRTYINRERKKMAKIFNLRIDAKVQRVFITT